MTDAKKTRSRNFARQPAADGSGPLASLVIVRESVKSHSKTDTVIALLNRQEGATLDAMVAATGWLPHTTRAALTGLRKKGYEITSEKVDGKRTYRTVGTTKVPA